MNLSIALMFGGVPHRPQIKTISRGVDILVATPGRLIQHLEERNLVLAGTEILVLDEADQMLDTGFIRPIPQIPSKLSTKRQSLFQLFADPCMRRTIVFTRTKRGADKVARHLDTAGIKVATIHGNKSQGQREAALRAFARATPAGSSRLISPRAASTSTR